MTPQGLGPQGCAPSGHTLWPHEVLATEDIKGTGCESSWHSSKCWVLG